MKTQLSHLKVLESEAMFIIREVAAEFERPCLMFSGGKDSILVLTLAVKAFAPAPVPFPILHVDTGHNFPEVIEFRDKIVEQYGLKLIVASVQDQIDSGKVKEETGPGASRNFLQISALLEAIEEHKFDACFGGARRDEEKARAKERIYSFRDEFGQWDPKGQRPELWSLYNGRCNPGENMRIFPISNWTELDVWNYINEMEVEVPDVYLAHHRDVFERDGMWMAVTEHLQAPEGTPVENKLVRFRTIGDATITGAVESPAKTLEQVIEEIGATRTTERGATRADDRRTEAAMEDRKKEGYF